MASDSLNMAPRSIAPGMRGTARHIRARIERGGERVWSFQDFAGAPQAAVAQSLSRLAREGTLQRLSKGVYYHGRNTSLGRSRPNPAAVRALATRGGGVFPAGIAAANVLGFTTQQARRAEVATRGFRLPRKLLGHDTIVYTRRPEAWAQLSSVEAAILDFLRRGGRTSELSPEATAERLLALMRHPRRFSRLLQVAATEPPRVRAVLGAVGDAIGKPARSLQSLRQSLNPLSRYDFGLLAALPSASAWQAKRSRA